MEKKVEFKSGNEILHGTLFIPNGKGPFPAVVFFHGNGGKGEKYYLAGKKIAESGILALAFNFSGCGESSGNYLEQIHEDAFRDGLSAYKFLITQPEADKERIGIVGGSFGGYIVAMILPEIKIKSLILLSPSAHDDPGSTKLDMGLLEKEVEYFAKRTNWEKAQSYKNIEEFKGPILIIKSDNDDNIPPEVIDKYYESASNAFRKEIITIKGADHRLSTPEMKEKFFNMISDWFLKTL